MGQPSQYRNAPSGAIQNREALRVCNLAGIKLAKERVIKLKNLRTGLDVALKDLEAQKRREEIIDKATMVLRFTKASCDAFIGLAAELSTIALPGSEKAAKIVKATYGMADAAADAAGTGLAGGKIDYVKTGAAMTKAAGDLVPDKGMKYLVKSHAVKAEMVKAAIDGDPKKLKKTSIDYAYELGRFSLDALSASKTKAFVGIAKHSFEYNEKIGTAVDELFARQMESIDRYYSLRTTLVIQSRKLQKKIEELEEFLASCETPELPTAPSLRLG